MTKWIFLICVFLQTTSSFAFCDYGVTITGNNGVSYCRSAGDTKTQGQNAIMNWWSAQLWCRAQNMHLVTMDELCTYGVNTWDGSVGYEKCPNFVNSGISKHHVWTATEHSSTQAYDVWIDSGKVRSLSRVSDIQEKWTDGAFAMCAEGCALGDYLENGRCLPCGDAPENSNVEIHPECCRYWNEDWGFDAESGQCVPMCSAESGGRCKKNTDCCVEGEFCRYSPNSCDFSGTGVCTPVSNFNPIMEMMSDGKVWVRSESYLDWWSTQNWCTAQGMLPASRENIGCSTLAFGEKCTDSAILDAIRQRWNLDRWYWLEDAGNSCRAHNIRLNTGEAGDGNTRHNSKALRPLCLKERVCALGEYEDDNGQCHVCESNPSEPSVVQEAECCSYYEFEWNASTNTCGCPSGSTWFSEAQICLPDDMCVYYFERPEAPSTVRYQYAVNSSYVEVKPLTYRVIKDDCKWPQYCVLAFVDENETRNDSAITGYTYGRCGMGY